MARQEREIAARDKTQARAGFLPQSHLQSGIVYNSPRLDDRATVSFIPLNAIREYTTLFTVTQELDTSGRLRADLARARAGLEAAGAALGLSQRDLKRAVTASYYRLLLTRRIVAITGDALTESRSFARRTKLLAESGEAARADVVKASAQAAFLEQTLSAAQLEARLASQELASFWTQETAETLAVEDVLDQPPTAPEAEAVGTLYLRRLEFNLLDARRKGFQAEARGARAGLLPRLDLVFQYGIDSEAVRIRDRGYATYVNLNIPVFDWLKARAAVRQFELRGRQVETNRAISERLFSRDYQNARERVKRFFEQISLTREQVKLAEEDLLLSRVRYEGGEGAALEVVTAQNGYAQARANHYTALANYLNARADLEVASGR